MEQTDFEVRISGDSMVSLYHLGKMLHGFRKRFSLANGEIGIFNFNVTFSITNAYLFCDEAI